MSKKSQISIIIPTWKRKKFLNTIINSLQKKQIKSNVQFEILIIDSSKKKIIFNSQNIKHFNVSRNSNALKRNFGISKAKFENIVFLDDDCIPDRFFLSDYSKIFKKIDKKTIVNGTVTYENKDIKKNIYLKIRQQSHFVVKKNLLMIKENLNPSHVVTMNLGFKKTNKIKKYFDERFESYGFEDFEFCYRLKKKGFKFYKGSPLVIHKDNRSFKKYLFKFYYLGNISSKIFKKINYEAYKKTNYFKIENFFITKKFKKKLIFSQAIYFLSIFFYKLNLLIFCKSKLIIKVNLLLFYLIGCLDRDNGKKRNLKWYL